MPQAAEWVARLVDFPSTVIAIGEQLWTPSSLWKTRLPADRIEPRFTEPLRRYFCQKRFHEASGTSVIRHGDSAEPRGVFRGSAGKSSEGGIHR
jgi:hypothetical protein